MPSSFTPQTSDNRDSLRRELRAARRKLSPAYRLDAEFRIAALLAAHRWYRNARRIGFYFPIGAELDTSALMVLAATDRKAIHLPGIMRPGARLRFVRAYPDSDYCLNRHDIPEPIPRNAADVIGARRLDLVLMPLLGFDDKGNRLGSGAGYYDRSFDFKRRLPDRRPRLLGLAYDCQRVAALQPASWDVRMDGVVTESGFYSFNTA